MKKNLPANCPSCRGRLSVKSLICETCDTQVSGIFSLPLLGSLSDADQEFIINFVKSSGSLKLMAKQMNLSYPTVRNRLDEVIARIEEEEEEKQNNDKN